MGGSLGKGKEGLVQVVELTKKMQMSEEVQIKCRCGNSQLQVDSVHSQNVDISEDHVCYNRANRAELLIG